MTAIHPLRTRSASAVIHGMDEEFSSAVRPDGRFGAVFEADGEASYLYLLDMAAPKGQQIVSALKTPDRAPGEPNAEVQWSRDGEVAAAIRGGKILAVMDLRVSATNLQQAGRAPVEDDALLFGNAR